MLDDGRLAAARDEAELLDTRFPGFLHRILDQGLVDDGQHLLGQRLGGGQEARAQARDGQDSLAKRLVHNIGSFRNARLGLP